LLSHCRELVYHPRVFIFPPRQAIYANEIERKQDFSEAVATYHAMQKAYEAFGDELIEVLRWSVVKRAGFILAKVSEGCICSQPSLLASSAIKPEVPV
jgi:predicted ATPase